MEKQLVDGLTNISDLPLYTYSSYQPTVHLSISRECLSAASALARKRSSSLQSFYYYDGPGITLNAELADKLQMHSNIRIVYPAKVNPHSRILASIAHTGIGVEASSPALLSSLLNAGFDGSRIIVSGPGKTAAFITQALEAGVETFIMESPYQLELLKSVYSQVCPKRPVSYLVRLQYTNSNSESNPVGRKHACHLGSEFAAWQTTRLGNFNQLTYQGVQLFHRSNVLKVEELESLWINYAELGKQFSELLQLPLKTLNVGGGVGLSYSGESASWQFIGHKLNQIVLNYGYQNVTFEPGRRLVGPYGLYATPVVDKKIVGSNNILVLGGGMCHFARYALFHRTGPCVVLRTGKRLHEQQQRFLLFGSSPTAADCLGSHLLPENIEIGDWLAFTQAGAYGYTQSLPLFQECELASEHYLDFT